MAKNLNLGNFLTISRSNISKLQIFLKNRFHSNWRSYLVLTSVQKQKKIVRTVFEKNIKVPGFGIIWRPFCEYFQIKNFFQKSGSVTLSEKSLEPFLRKLRYQPTKQPNKQPTNNYQQQRSYRTSLTPVQKAFIDGSCTNNIHTEGKRFLWEVNLVFYIKIFRVMCRSMILFWNIAV